MSEADRWTRIEAALDELMDLPAADRAAAIERLAAGDPGLRAELQALAAQLDGADSLLDRPAAAALSLADEAVSELPPGARVGPWRIVSLIGRGGMGEVHAAERADGEFQQRVAIKLVRAGAPALAHRFQRERQIVARLDHPGIARLLDGGVLDDGRPYMVIELVAGQPLIEWCTHHAATLERRLALFDQVCAAVAYAHRNLVVHRDLKPSNVLVTDDGQVKLLDFGIARLLDAPAGGATQELLLTPGYAAPEQVSGGPVTTAADVYALGLLLYELVAGRPAHPVQSLPLAAALHEVLTREPPPPSVAAANPRLRGDLDAIVAKALRKEPDARYASVDALREDVARHLRHEPVAARQGRWAYRAGRAIRRHRAATAAAALAVLLLLGGSAAVAWQARVAREEAARATAVKEFLLGIFKASDPRVASDKPRGEITARELLNAGTARVQHDFDDQPALKIELIGLMATLQYELGDRARWAELQNARLALAQRHPGQFGQAELDALDSVIPHEIDNRQFDLARRHLDDADRLLHKLGLDDTDERGFWYFNLSGVLDRGALAERQAALEKAVAIYERVAPNDPVYGASLNNLATTHMERGDAAGAAALWARALKVQESSPDRLDSEVAVALANLAGALADQGLPDEALQDLRRAVDLTLRSYGEHNYHYWRMLGKLAVQLHVMGQRAEAQRLFARQRELIGTPPENYYGLAALEYAASRAVAEGDAAAALPTLLALQQRWTTDPADEAGLRRLRLDLGTAYAQLGRVDDARRSFAAAIDEYRQKETVDRATRVAATERWARFLIDQGDLSAAQAALADVQAADPARRRTAGVLALADAARLAQAQGDTRRALALADDARVRWDALHARKDVRGGTYLHRVHAAALLAAGDAGAAAREAQQALDEALAHDAPAAPSVSEARQLLAQAAGRRS